MGLKMVLNELISELIDAFQSKKSKKFHRLYFYGDPNKINFYRQIES